MQDKSSQYTKKLIYCSLWLIAPKPLIKEETSAHANISIRKTFLTQSRSKMLLTNKCADELLHDQEASIFLTCTIIFSVVGK